jgi:hypothetical protein
MTQFFKQRLRLLQILGVKPFGESSEHLRGGMVPTTPSSYPGEGIFGGFTPIVSAVSARVPACPV